MTGNVGAGGANDRTGSLEAPPATGEWILHVDLDQFLAAVEILRRPELRGLPVVVGGDGDPTRARQVVSTASYEARAFGVRSGIPLRMAARKCPDAIFLPLDAPTYEAASAEVMATLRSFPVVLEVWGWDEAFAGARTDSPEALAEQMRAAVRERTGLVCSIGIGETKLQAKTATGFAKPDGVSMITSATWMSIMGDRPTEALWGVGRRTSDRLDEAGITTVAQLATADLADLSVRLGPTIGPYLRSLGMGGGDRTVTDEPWVARSKSRETTYPQDLTDRGEIEKQVTAMAESLTRDVAADGRVVVRVAVKVRTASFYTRTKISKLPAPTSDPGAVAMTARAVLGRFELDRPVRLLGVRVELAPPDAEAERSAAVTGPVPQAPDTISG
jgi:DNA polymerase-4